MTISKTRSVALSLSALAIAISANVQAAPTFIPGLQSSATGIEQTSPLPKRYIVKFKNAQAAASFQSGSDEMSVMSYVPRTNEVFSHHRALNSVSAREMKRIGRSNSYTAKLDPKSIQSLRLRSDVDYVEEDMPRQLLSETTPWGQTYVGATSLSDAMAGNRTICIIDSGYDRDHGDLSGNIVTGTNNIGTDSWFDPGINNAHGTHVAGTIAAIANDSGVIGVMPNQTANIHVVKVFNEAGWGYSSSLVSAIDTCVNNGANVVTMSLGGPSYNQTEDNAIAAHANNDVLFIAASGNAGNNTHSYPASYDAVMSVAAVDNNKDHAEFSQYTNQVEISGPGEAILSTVTLGEGRLADITINGQSYFDIGVVPHNRLVGADYDNIPINGSITDELAECLVSDNVFSCGNMNAKVCLVERVGNQLTGVSYPDIEAVKACHSAGASAVIVYSNSELPGLQNPFLFDRHNEAPLVSVSVDRATGQALQAQIGSSVTVANTANEDYAYYNGTSMATPHVSGVATLVWSHHTECSAEQIRSALNATAEDLATAGRDNQTGYGLIDAVAAKAYLDASCDGPSDPGTGPGESVLENSVAKNSLAGAKNDELHFSLDVPANATDLSFTMSGGSGDADLYVQYAAAPTSDSYDCRPWESGNAESCPISNTQAGTYYVMVQGYTAFSGVSLVANFTESTGGGGNTGGPATYTNTNGYAIPDNSSVGVTSPISATRTGDSGTVTVNVNISHTYIGDLQVELHSPSGQFSILHDNAGGSSNDIVQSYTVDMTGVESAGDWTLKAVDSARRDTGTINNWQLTFQ
ncbi:S8 family serine peptidase [Shewanella sp.]|uniref:S8 family serine peptidase n=1 Tax=Shewanella sp. TaxID=50422 RepID=UPI001ED4B5EF|nr:S8 family serine peptidase [Shewanella sp.]NRB24799.1 S8 family serine peptidase [Shewanella sp.]